MQISSVGKMGIRFAASGWLLVILLTAATVASSASEPVFVVLKQPFKIKVRYGETRLPAGMKLQVVSIDDPAGVQVVYMGEIQTIPKDIVEFEAASTEQQNVTPRPNARANPPSSSSTTAVGPAQPTLSLAWGWDSPMQGGDITMRELESLLFHHCKPSVDLGGYDINIYNGVRYLMDCNEAARVLGVRGSIPSRVSLATPGFPRNTMFYVAYDGNFEGHFNRLYLVTDAANKIVSVQLVDEHPKGGCTGTSAGNWITYNFINTRLASSLVHVMDESARDGDVIRIETRMCEPKKTGRKSSSYEEVENTKLLIPIPFAQVILHYTQIGLSKR